MRRAMRLLSHRLKTANPLLVLSMETMIDEIHARCKPLTEEELFRVMQTLLLECYQQAVGRLSQRTLTYTHACYHSCEFTEITAELTVVAFAHARLLHGSSAGGRGRPGRQRPAGHGGAPAKDLPLVSAHERVQQPLQGGL